MSKNLKAKDKKNMSKAVRLPIDFGEIDTTKAETSDFISRLQSSGFISKNKAYLSNYVNADLGIAFSHIKNTYKIYVLEGDWTESKYETVLYAIIDNGEMLVPRAFMKNGIKYDKNELKERASIPEEEEYSDDELLRHIMNEVGGDV